MGWVSALIERGTLRRRVIVALAGAIAIAAILFVGMQAAQAITGRYGVSLPGSDFQIENATPNTLPGANLKVDTADEEGETGLASKDWANVPYDKKPDLPTGQNDNSFVQGTKEDTPIPTIEAGSIPNNKSDLLNFGMYLEKTANNQSFLHLFWHRVQEPTGTTNMDFEFNKRQCTPPNELPPNTTDPDCTSNRFTPIRSEGDVLIQYDLSQGGTNPTLWLSRWLTPNNGHTKADCEANNSLPCWSKKANLTASGDATGSINNQAIPASESGGLITTGQISPRTFGEASVDFDALGTGTDPCTTFGGAYLKSRASDSFTAALKDFIAPLNRNIGNCGNIVIKKETDPDGSTQSFPFTLTRNNANVIAPFSLTDGQSKDSGGIVPGSGYVAAETVPAGWDLTSATCSDGSPVTNIDVSVGETVTCTFNNRQQSKIVVEKVTSDGTGTFDFTSGTLSPSSFDLTTTAEGAAGKDSETFSNLTVGTYDVAETDKSGWDLTSATCDDGSDPDSIGISAGESVTCTFTNTKKTTTISTSQSFTPQDTVNIGGGGTGTFNGQVDFELYKGEDCTGTAVYFEKNVSLPASGTLKTTNGGPAGANHSAEYTISGDGTGEYHWKVSYHNDTNGHSNASSCVEESTVTIDNDNTP